MKPVRFVGDALAELRAFPHAAQHDAGYQLHRVQTGGQPADFEPMPTIGQGVQELRVRDATGAYRVIYTARLAMPSMCCTHSKRKPSAPHRPTSNWHANATSK